MEKRRLSRFSLERTDSKLVKRILEPPGAEFSTQNLKRGSARKGVFNRGRTQVKTFVDPSRIKFEKGGLPGSIRVMVKRK